MRDTRGGRCAMTRPPRVTGRITGSVTSGEQFPRKKPSRACRLFFCENFKAPRGAEVLADD
jgi:hypothetical protein